MASSDLPFLRLALKLARRGYGFTSPNPMVGAVLVRRGRVLGRGWHRRAGEPHAEIEAFRDALRRGNDPRGATLYVTLEPCSTHGRTPPCTEAILRAGVTRVVAAATDPNPSHAGRGFEILARGGVTVAHGELGEAATRLNEGFNHWIVTGTPFVTVKAALTLDGKIATAAGESKWITGEPARRQAMRLRLGADAILVGINTVLADDPSLTVRSPAMRTPRRAPPAVLKPVRRLVLDSQARTPPTSTLASDSFADGTTIFVSRDAPARRVNALAARVQVVRAPSRAGRLDLRWILRHLGRDAVTSLLVEGGGEVNASFLEQDLAQRVAFFYAPTVLGERAARNAVAGAGFTAGHAVRPLRAVRWRRLGDDLFLTARAD